MSRLLGRDSHGNVCYLVCSDTALEYVPSEVVHRGMPLGQGMIVGPEALAVARLEKEKNPGYKIYMLTEIE